MAQSEFGILGVAVLLTRVIPRPDAGMHKVVEVDNLVVRADQRGRRIGRRLLAAVVEWSRQRRASQVEVCIGDVNRDAKRFYEASASPIRSIGWCWRHEPDRALRVRTAGMGDYDSLCLLFDELDAFHRDARPHDVPAVSAAGAGAASRWRDGWPTPARRSWWRRTGGQVGLALLLTRPPSPFAGAVPRKVSRSTISWCAPTSAAGGSAGACSQRRSSGRGSAGATDVEVAVHDFNQEAERFYELSDSRDR